MDPPNWLRRKGGALPKSKKIGRVKDIVSNIFKDGSMPLIGARFGNDRDLGAGMLAVFGAYVSLSILNSRTASTPSILTANTAGLHIVFRRARILDPLSKNSFAAACFLPRETCLPP